MPTYLVVKKVHSKLESKFSTVDLTVLKIHRNEKVKFKVALRKYLNTHCCYSLDEPGMCKDDP
jgi:hypothetical protein